MRQLVIFGGLDDPHTLKVSRLLIDNGYDPIYLDPIGNHPKSLRRSGVHPTAAISGIRFSDRTPCRLEPAEMTVWWRSKRNLHYIPTPTDQSHYYAISENTSFLRGVVETGNVPEFNSRRAVYAHENKIVQLTAAASVGLLFPETLISSDKGEILKFVREQRQCLVKPLKMNFVPPPLESPSDIITIMANIITPEEIEAVEEEQFSVAPAIYQEYIQKEYELRFVVFGDDAVSFGVDSQNSRFGKTDWRRAQFEKIYFPDDVDRTLLSLCSKYLDHVNLKYGVFDFIKTPDGRYVFLECNADGQWAWLEGLNGSGPIAKMYAENIIRLLQ